MNGLSLGDLANSFMLQQRGNALKLEMSRLTQELTSGQVSDVRSVLSGNYSYLTDIETNLTTLNGYKTATSEAAQFSSAMQSVLGNIQDTTSRFGTDLITVSSGGLDSVAVQASEEALETLKGTINALNSDSAGRSIFAGAATNKPPLGATSDLLNELRTIVTGLVGAVPKISAIENWFDDPAGFDAVFYEGSNTGQGPFRLSDTEDIALDLRATNPALKDTLRHLAMAALASDSALNVDATERQILLQKAGEGMLRNQDDLTALRANVGYSEARIELVATRNASEKLSLEYAKGSLLAADPYETATRLEEVQFQLQSLYTVTARSSDLSLVNFI